MKLIDLRDFDFILEPRYYFYGWSDSPKILGRESAVERLVMAKKLLPASHNFKIWDCYRPRKVQIAMIDGLRRKAKHENPGFSKREIEEHVYKYALKPAMRVIRLDTHRNGGSFDLTIVDPQGHELFMGTDFDDLSLRAATDYYENKKGLTKLEKIARDNRRLLKSVMTETGFKKIPNEWWHWNYDK